MAKSVSYFENFLFFKERRLSSKYHQVIRVKDDVISYYDCNKSEDGEGIGL